MKTHIKKLFILPALTAGLNLIPAGWVAAETFTTLHRFDGNDGATPWASLILSGNTLYGTTAGKGTWRNCTVFAIKTDGTAFTTLHSFTAISTNSSDTYTNSDGDDLEAGLVLSAGTLYGTASGGGSLGGGTVFAVGTNGTGVTTLHAFAGYPSDGANPRAGLILGNNTLYGTTVAGGSSDGGMVFTVHTDGTGLTALHSFTTGAYNSNGYYTNGDGVNPEAGLILSGTTLYGTAAAGGSSGNGTVFAVNINGTGFTNLHSFSAGMGSAGEYGTNSDGINPCAGLVLSGNTLYGTAVSGGSSGFGTVFAVSTDGTSFTNLHSFGAGAYDSIGYFTNNDGVSPYAGLFLSGNILYGTAAYGGSSGVGTVFAVNTDGTGFNTLHHFTGRWAEGGGYPFAGLVSSGNTLYGTTSDSWNDFLYGTVFSLSFQPQLTITPSGADVILSWPTNVAGFDYSGYILQSTTNLVSASVWSTNSTELVTGSWDNQVKVRDARSGRQLLAIKGRCVGCSRDGIIDVREAAIERVPLMGGGRRIAMEPVALSPDGQRIVKAGCAGRVTVSETTSGRELSVFKGPQRDFASVAFSPDGEQIVSGERKGGLVNHGNVIVWDADTGQELLMLKGHTEEVLSVAFSPDGKEIVSGSSDGTVKVWDAAGSRESLIVKGHTEQIPAIALAPNGHRIVTGSADKMAKVWETANSKAVVSFNEHGNYVLSVAFSPDGRRIVSGSRDRTVKVWEKVSGRELFTLKGHTEGVSWVAFSANGQRIASASLDSTWTRPSR